MGYTGSVDLVSGIRPKNNGTFPLVDAKDVRVDDNTRLDAALATISPVATGAVRYDAAQTLTDAQKQQARTNIGAGEVDATLSVEGMAADAKKTGDEIISLKEDYSDKLTTLANGNDLAFLVNYTLIDGRRRGRQITDQPVQDGTSISTNLFVQTNERYNVKVGDGYHALLVYHAQDGSYVGFNSIGYFTEYAFAPTNYYWSIEVRTLNNTEISVSDFDESDLRIALEDGVVRNIPMSTANEALNQAVRAYEVASSIQPEITELSKKPHSIISILVLFKLLIILHIFDFPKLKLLTYPPSLRVQSNN